MKHIIAALATLVILPAGAQKRLSAGGYPITPVPFTAVKVWNNTFWGQRLETSRNVTIPLAFSKCESEGRYKNFERAAENMKHPSDKYNVAKLMPFSFDDTDPYKTIEGASYILQTYPDKKLQHYVDSVINIIATAQEPTVTSTPPAHKIISTLIPGRDLNVGARRKTSAMSSITSVTSSRAPWHTGKPQEVASSST